MHVITVTWKNGPKWDPTIYPNHGAFIFQNSKDPAKATVNMQYLAGLPITIFNTISSDPTVSWVTRIEIWDGADDPVAIRDELLAFYENTATKTEFAKDYTVEVVASEEV